jgi:SET domain-containing protein
MPFLFKTEVKPSNIHGLGLYSLENIPQGAVYWTWNSPELFFPVRNIKQQTNEVYTQSKLSLMKDKSKLKEVLHGGLYVREADVYVDLRDGSQFTNHAEDCNSQVVFDPNGDVKLMTYVARKDISAGEEITDNYGNYLSCDKEWVDSLMREYMPDRKEIESTVISAQKLRSELPLPSSYEILAPI